MQRPLALSIVAALERVIDTLLLARRKHSGGLTLDDLCLRYRVDRSRCTQHGVLLDELLAVVYVELTTTRQAASGRGRTVKKSIRQLLACRLSSNGRLRATTSRLPGRGSRTFR